MLSLYKWFEYYYDYLFNNDRLSTQYKIKNNKRDVDYISNERSYYENPSYYEKIENEPVLKILDSKVLKYKKINNKFNVML